VLAEPPYKFVKSNPKVPDVGSIQVGGLVPLEENVCPEFPTAANAVTLGLDWYKICPAVPPVTPLEGGADPHVGAPPVFAFNT
jgi:hypothetical protein